MPATAGGAFCAKPRRPPVVRGAFGDRCCAKSLLLPKPRSLLLLLLLLLYGAARRANDDDDGRRLLLRNDELFGATMGNGAFVFQMREIGRAHV